MLKHKLFLAYIMFQVNFCFSSNIPDKDISEKSIKSEQGILFEGSHLQHYFVDEMINVIDTAISCDMIEDLRKVIIDLANASLVSNKAGDLILTALTLDACWSIIDFAKEIQRICVSRINLSFINIMLENFDQSPYKSTITQCNSVKATKNIVISFVMMGYCLGKVIYRTVQHKAVCDLLTMDQKRSEQILKKFLIDPVLFFVVYDECVKKISNQEIPLLDAKCAVYTLLFYGMVKLVSLVNKENLPIFLSCIRKGIQSCENETACRNITVCCAEEINTLLNKMQKII